MLHPRRSVHLGEHSRPLGEVRADELAAAADVLGVRHIELLDYPDGHLQDVRLEDLAELVENSLTGADLMLVFDEDGITGHPDHRRATQAPIAAAATARVPVWTLPRSVASQLNIELGAGFVGHHMSDIDIVIDVDRQQQRATIGCHASQSDDNPALWRRLELLGDREFLRWLDPRSHCERDGRRPADLTGPSGHDNGVRYSIR